MRFNPKLDLPPNHNVAPGCNVPVIVSDATTGEQSVELMKWGLVPHWAKEEKIGYKMINARSETIQEKPAFRESFKKRRCVVMVDGFYEWEPTTKQPHYYSPTASDHFNFAGIWSSWKKPDGTDLHSFSIITTQANETLAPVHNRMPAILGDNETGEWLSNTQDRDGLAGLIRPYSAGLMQEWIVSREVNNTRSCGNHLNMPLNSA